MLPEGTSATRSSGAWGDFTMGASFVLNNYWKIMWNIAKVHLMVNAALFMVRHSSYLVPADFRMWLVETVTRWLNILSTLSTIWYCAISSPLILMAISFKGLLNPWFATLVDEWLEPSTKPLPIQRMVLRFVIRPILEELIFRHVPDKLLRRFWHGSSLSKTREGNNAESENASALSMKVDNQSQVLYSISTFLFAVIHVSNHCRRNDSIVLSLMMGERKFNLLEQRLRECLHHCIGAYEIARLVLHPLYQQSSVWASYGAHACWNILATCTIFVGSYSLEVAKKIELRTSRAGSKV